VDESGVFVRRYRSTVALHDLMLPGGGGQQERWWPQFRDVVSPHRNNYHDFCRVVYFRDNNFEFAVN
jgi:hypothetical protein